MVGNLVSLKWAHFCASLRRSGWSVAGTIIGGIYALMALVGVVAGMMALREGDPALAQGVAVVVGTLATAVWCIVPLVLSGQDSTLDPDLLAPYPLKPRDIIGGQLLGSVVGIFGLVTLIGSLMPVLAWTSPGPALLALPAGIVGFVLLMVCSRLMSCLGMAIRHKRFLAETIGAIFFLALLCAGPIVSTLTSSLMSEEWVRSVANVTGWTPLGIAWALPGDLASGAWGLLILRSVLTVAYLAVGLWVWQSVIAYQISHVGSAPARKGGAAKSGRWLGLFTRFPATPSGAIAARTTTYYLKDPRLNLNLLMAPGFLILFGFMNSTGSGGFLLHMVGPIVGWMLAWQSAYVVSYDNTAFALHLTSPVRGISERWGRTLGMMVIFVPLVAFVSVAAEIIQGEPGSIPANLGLSWAVLLAGLGVGAVLSVRYALPVPAPGESPWKSRKNNAGLANALIQFVSSIAMWAITLPILILMLAASITHVPVFDWIILIAGPVYGALIVWLGVRMGGTWYERKAPELYQDLVRMR